MNLSMFSIRSSARADAVKRNDGSTGTALSNSLKLGQVAVAFLIHGGATGNLTFVDPDGNTHVIDVATDRAQGVWHLEQIAQVLATGTTVAATALELGWSGV
jgi:hypothetical protein